MSLANAHNDSRHIKSTTAFVVETLILLVALVSSMGVLTQLFSQSIAASQQSERLCQAVSDRSPPRSSPPTPLASPRVKRWDAALP